MPPLTDQSYNNAVALGAVAIVIVAALAGLAVANYAQGSGSPSPGPITYLNLTIAVNETYGVPQYSPANFTVHSGVVMVTITDHDVPASWEQCSCEVSGTVGGTESLNGTPVSYVSPANVAHTFSIAPLDINVLSPGQSVVSFELSLSQTGSFRWLCLAPCGNGPGGWGFPMYTPGFMEGTMTVV